MTAPQATMVQRPIAMAVEDCFAALGSVVEDEVFDRVRSPRSWASAIITVLPARVMLGVPLMAARRETLLPESCGLRFSTGNVETGQKEWSLRSRCILLSLRVSHLLIVVKTSCE